MTEGVDSPAGNAAGCRTPTLISPLLQEPAHAP